MRCHRRQRHRIAPDGDDHKHQHVNTTTVDVIESSQAGIDDRKPCGANEHQNPPPVAIHKPNCNKCEDEIDCSSNDNVEQNLGNVVSGSGEYLFCVVKDYIDTTHLSYHV